MKMKIQVGIFVVQFNFVCSSPSQLSFLCYLCSFKTRLLNIGRSKKVHCGISSSLFIRISPASSIFFPNNTAHFLPPFFSSCCGSALCWGASMYGTTFSWLFSSSQKSFSLDILNLLTLSSPATCPSWWRLFLIFFHLLCSWFFFLLSSIFPLSFFCLNSSFLHWNCPNWTFTSNEREKNLCVRERKKKKKRNISSLLTGSLPSCWHHTMMTSHNTQTKEGRQHMRGRETVCPLPLPLPPLQFLLLLSPKLIQKYLLLLLLLFLPLLLLLLPPQHLCNQRVFIHMWECMSSSWIWPSGRKMRKSEK